MSIVIDQVTLENFKSYGDETTIDLGTGVTAILGDNGSGKSTIQEGVGYALFDTHPFRNQDRLVRDGENSGHVEVTFTNRATGEAYTVRRWAGRSKYDVLDETGDNLELDTNTEVKDWICHQLGIDNPDDLSEAWERSVGVPQTDFLSDFTKTETDRIDTFDPLFDIERYREAYKSLSGLDDEFEGEIDDLEEEITRLEAKLEDLPEVQSDVEEFESAVDDLEDELQSLTDDIADLEEGEDELKALEEKLEDAKRELEALEETKIPAQQDSLDAAKQRRDEAKEAQALIEEVEDNYQRYEDAQDQLDDLREEREERDGLKEQLSDVGGQIDRLNDQVARHKEDLREVKEAEVTLDDLEPKKERYEALEKQIDDLEDAENRIDEIDERDEEIDGKISELEEELDEVEAEIEEAEAKRDEADQLTDLQNQRQSLLARKQSLESERDELRAQNEELRELDLDEESEVDCPTCDRPVTAEHRDTVIERNDARLEEITEQELPQIASDIEEIEGDIASAQAAQDAVDQIPRLEDKRDGVSSEINELRDEKQELRDEREELEDDVAALPDKRAERDDLEGVVDDYHMAKATVENAGDVSEELRATREELGEKRVEYRALQEDLAEYEGLDDEIESVKEVIDDTEDAHRTYVRHEDTAAELSDRREEVEEEEEELEDLKTERVEVKDRIESLQDEFDADRLSEVQDELADLKEQRAKTEQKLEDAQSDLEEAREELAALEDKQDRKQESEEEVVELERDQEFARWARNSLQQGAEDLRDLITSEIGDRANTIFQQLRGNPTETLVWNKTYNLRVRVRGQNKPFDTLSGGEKMAAALSVRLAILEQLASLGVAFLDEPTANLDQQKKQNLVSQLDDLDQLNQLLVVSHDRTFESMTERTIELEKDEDKEMTRVVSE